MNNRRKWTNRNYNQDLNSFKSEDNSSVLPEQADILTFKELIFKLIADDINIVSTSILRKIIIFKGLNPEKYYKKIEELVVESKDGKQVEKGINKIAKEIIEEMNY